MQQNATRAFKFFLIRGAVRYLSSAPRTDGCESCVKPTAYSLQQALCCVAGVAALDRKPQSRFRGDRIVIPLALRNAEGNGDPVICDISADQHTARTTRHQLLHQKFYRRRPL